MFPTTRQSLVVPTVLWGLLLMFCASSLCMAQDDPALPDDAEATEPAEDVEQWDAPAWVMDPDAAEKFRRSSSIKLNNALKSKNPSADHEKLLRRQTQYYLSQLTHPEKSDLPKKVVDRFFGQTTNSFTSPAARDMMLDEVLEKAPALLQHPNEVTRYNTVLLLSSLSTDKASINPAAPARPYVRSHVLLCDIMQDTTQLLECRIMAARGLSRILKDGDPSSNQQSQIGLALTETLKSVPAGNDDGSWWFRFRISEALGFVGRLDNVEDRTENVLIALRSMLNNPKEKIVTRCQAVLSISQLPFGSSTDVDGILYDTNKLLQDLSVAYNGARKKGQMISPIWRMSFSRIYLAYRPASSKEAGKNWGFLYKGISKFNTLVSRAWVVAFPVLKPVVGNQAGGIIPDADITSLKAWVTSKKPAAPKPSP